jgi:hypothetical protein
MTRIGVLSDTHLSSVTEEFRTVLGRTFSDVDLIIHAGDMTSRPVYDYLCNWDLRAVAGNMDDDDLRVLLPEKRIEVVSGRRIGIMHGRGPAFGVEHLVLRHFDDVDIVVFGHTHIPANAARGSVRLCNPGSYRSSRTLGILELGEEVDFRLVEIE